MPSAGCFSCCRPRTRWGPKKQEMKLPEVRLAILPTSVENRIAELKPDEVQKVYKSVVPTTTEYITASGKQALALLDSAARIIPVPFLQDAIGVALKIIEVCEDASAVEKKVKDLQDRVCNLMIVIVDNVTATSEQGSEAVVKAAKGFERDIRELLSTLRAIHKELTEVSEQNRLLTVIYKELNMSSVEACLDRLSTALEKFTLANNLRDSELLLELHGRLANIQVLTQEVAKKVDDVQEDVRDIKRILYKSHRLAMLHRSETVIRQQIPLKPEVFHGRDSVVEEIAQLLTKEETSRVCILGPGGTGKTSVLLAVVELPLITERFPGENCVWVPCIEATSATLFLEILYIQLQVPGEMRVTLERIISELDTSKLPRLLLLDNFETPWNASGKTQKQIGDILRKLAALSHIAILVTMRGTYPPCDMIRWQPQTIQPINEAASYHIFLDINPNSKDDPDVGCLLAVLGHMPFAITLMANLGKRGKSTAKELLNTWYISGTNMLSATNSPERSINQSISLSVDSEFVKQDPDALLLLAILSMLPAGTTRQNLCWWAPTIKIIPSAIATLCDAALLVETRQQNSSPPVFFVLPVVQSFMHQQDRITEAVKKQVLSSCCQYISDHACRYYDDSTYAIKSKALIIEDTNIQSILFGSSTVQHIHFSNTTIEAFIAFCWHCCDTKPNLEIANHIVTIAKASMIDKYIASAVWCLGRTYHQLSDYNLSYGHLQKAHQLFLNAFCLANGDLKLQQLSAQCAIDLVDTACMALQNADEIVSLARDVETQCAALSDNFIHGQSLVFLGRALNIAHKWKEALSYLNRAQIMLLAVGNTSNLAITYQLIARVYHYEKRLPEALNAIEEAWKYAEMTSSLYIQGIISREFCTILFSANRGMEAWKYAEIALEKASHVANQLTVAHALQYMGYGYLHKGDYQNAYDAYEAAADKYHGTVNAILGETCRDNVAKIQQKQNNPDAIIGFYRPDFDLDKSLFYPSPPESLFSLSK